MVEAGTRLAPRHLDQLRRSCGDIVTPDDEGYDETRRLWNAIHDRRPSVIARPRNAQEVAAAVAFGREHDLEIAVQSGGHAARGLAGPDGGLVINLSNMRGVEVDPSDPDRPGERRRLPRRARHRRTGAWPRLPGRGRRPYRRRRADPRWGSRPPPAPLRADHRQPGCRRARHRRWPARARDGDRRARALLGPPRRRLELRDRDGVRVPAPAVRTGPASGRPDVPGGAGAGDLGHRPRLRGAARPMPSR